MARIFLSVPALAAAALAIAPLPSPASTLDLISRVDPAFVSETAMGESAPAGSHSASADGRYWAFTSTAPNLVAGQIERNFAADVFLYDRVAGSVTLVSRAAGTASTTAGAASDRPVVSADGRFVAFVSQATDLVAGQSPTFPVGAQIFLWDRVTGSTVLVSHAATSALAPSNGFSQTPSLSADGRFVAYTSQATDLIAGQSPGSDRQIYLYDRTSPATVLVSRAAGVSPTVAGNQGAEADPEISADGQLVSFASAATNLVAGQDDTNGALDLFVYDRLSGGMGLVSHGVGFALRTGAGGPSRPGPWSADGRYLAYDSSATDLVAGQTPSPFGTESAVFLWDRLANGSTLVSHTPAGPAAVAEGRATVSAVSSDGRFVAFSSTAFSLIPDSFGAVSNAFLFDRTTGSVTLASHPPGLSGGRVDHESTAVSLSDDGRFLAFVSKASNLVAGQQEGNEGNDVFLFDRMDGTVALVSRKSGSASRTGNGLSASPLLSRDGRWVGYASAASDVGDRADHNGRGDFLLFDRLAGTNGVVSVRDPGMPSQTLSQGVPSPSSLFPAVSADGRWVAFFSSDAHVVPGQQTTPAWHRQFPTVYNVFLYDRVSRTTRLVSHAPGSATVTANGTSGRLVMSPDGRFIAFVSAANNLVPLDGSPDGESSQLYLYDQTTTEIVLVSRSVEPDWTRSNGRLWDLALSADGRLLAFNSDATNLVSGVTYAAESHNVFVYDRTTGAVSLVTRSATNPAAAATSTGLDTNLSWSADGRYLAMTSQATNLVPGQIDRQVDGEDTADAFVYDRVTGTFRLVSHASLSPTATADRPSRVTKMSADGRVLAFTSAATNLLPSPSVNFGEQALYLYDVGSGALAQASPSSLPLPAADLNRDGRFAVYSGDSGKGQVYLYDRQTGDRTLISHAAGSPTTGGSSGSTEPKISADGRYVAFMSTASNLVSGQIDSIFSHRDIFLYDRQSGTAALVSGRAGSPVQPADLSSGPVVLSADGTTVVFPSYARDLLVNDFNDVEDLFVYRRDTHPGAFFTVPPCRLLDTRAAGQGPALASGEEVTWDVYAVCGIPSTARALSVNLTVVSPTGDGFLTLFPGDGPVPPTSTINFRAGQVRANNAVVPLATGGEGSLAARASIGGNGAVHIILDVNGYFE